MFIKLSITIILFLSTLSSFAQTKDSIYGNVKSIREQVVFLDSTRQNGKLFSHDGDYGHSGFIKPEWTKDAFFNYWFKTPYVHYINYYEEFNKNGKPINEIWYDKSEDTVSIFNYLYDKNENLIQIKETSNPDWFTVRNFTYNFKKNLTTSLFYASYDPNFYSYKLYLYDSMSNLIAQKKFNDDGEPSNWYYEYDFKNRKITDIMHQFYIRVKTENGSKVIPDTIGIKRISKKYIYDEEDRIIETQNFNYGLDSEKISKPVSRFVQLYDKDLLREEQYITDSLIYRIEFKYDSQNRLIEKRKTNIKNLRFNQLLEYEYDENDNIIKLAHTENSITKVVTFNYKFDKHNNWIKQIKSVDGVELYIWTRDIKYHN